MKYTEKQILEMLADKYSLPEWLFLPHTKIDDNRIADGIAVNLYNYRGHVVHGFEVKCSRADFLSEIKKPDKAEAIAQYCDFWWIVTPLKDENGKHIVHNDELPLNWGYLAINENGSFIKKKKPVQNEVNNPNRRFWGTLLRKFSNMEDITATMERRIQEAKRSEYDRGFRNGTEASNPEEHQWRTKYETLDNRVKELAVDLGLDPWEAISTYGKGKLADYIKLGKAIFSSSEFFVSRARAGIKSAEKELKNANDNINAVDELLKQMKDEGKL